MKKIFVVIFLLFIGVFSQIGEAGLSNLAFWKNHVSSLVFTTAAQSIYASNCSGAVTIQNKNWMGVATNVGANVTVNLSATGSVTFYSDSFCTQTVTTTTINSGSNSSTVYFISATTGSPVVTAAATNYSSITQTETISTNPYVWTGGGGNANWNTLANWSGGAAPGAGNLAVFDSTCASNCSPTVNVSINVGGVRMASTYTGTITQGAASTMTIGSSAWTQNGGAFLGGSSNMIFTGPFSLSGGSFTMTSAATSAKGSLWSVSSPAVFSSNSGSLSFGNTATDITMSLVVGDEQYNNVTFGGGNNTFNLTGSMKVYGNLTFSPFDSWDMWVNGSTISAYGNVTATFRGSRGTALVRIAGNAAGQTLSSSSLYAALSKIEIDAGTNTVTLGTTVSTNNGFSVTSVGTLITAGSTLWITGTDATVSAPGYTFNDLQFSVCTARLNNATLTIGGNLTLANGCGCGNYIHSGTMNVHGNVTATACDYRGSATLTFVGSGAQTMTGGEYRTWSTVGVAKPSGTLTFGSAVTWPGISVTSGSLDMAGWPLTLTTLSLGGNTLTKGAGVLTVNGVVQGTGSLFGGTIDP